MFDVFFYGCVSEFKPNNLQKRKQQAPVRRVTFILAATFLRSYAMPENQTSNYLADKMDTNCLLDTPAVTQVSSKMRSCYVKLTKLSTSVLNLSYAGMCLKSFSLFNRSIFFLKEDQLHIMNLFCHWYFHQIIGLVRKLIKLYYPTKHKADS